MASSFNVQNCFAKDYLETITLMSSEIFEKQRIKVMTWQFSLILNDL